MSKPTKSSSQRGLGQAHRKQRATLLNHHTDGTPCWWCGKPMYRNHTRNWDYNPNSKDPGNGALAADHTLARAHGGTRTDRLLHGTCNKERGDGSRDHLRPTLTGTPPPTNNHLDTQAMPWP